jgi:hypothetical protein
VVTTSRGRLRLLQIEDGLGTNRDWDQTYFHHELEGSWNAVLASRMIGRPVAVHDSSVAVKLELVPGQSVWRVDGHCGASDAARLNARLSGLDPNPKVVWREPIEHGIYTVTIRRYQITVPIALAIQHPISER